MNRRDEQGFAFLWALFLVVLVTAMTSVMLERDQQVRRDGVRDAQDLNAFHAAEGGLEKARHALARDPAFAGTTLALGPSTVRIEARPLPEGGWRVTSEARPGNARLEARLVPTAGLPRVSAWRRQR